MPAENVRYVFAAAAFDFSRSALKRKSMMLKPFLDSIADTPWLAHAGESFEGGIVVSDVVAGWDEWNQEMLETWSPRTHALELLARTTMGESGIDHVFAAVSASIDTPVRSALERYFDRRPDMNENTSCAADRGLWPELLDTIKRDVAWAAIEFLLHNPGFFTYLLTIYRQGRWPCSWKGVYPHGSVVLL